VGGTSQGGDLASRRKKELYRRDFEGASFRGGGNFQTRRSSKQSVIELDDIIVHIFLLSFCVGVGVGVGGGGGGGGRGTFCFVSPR